MRNPYIYITDQNFYTAKQNFDRVNPTTMCNKINKQLKNIPFMPENFNTSGFVKGLIVGGIAAYILNNPRAQECIFKAIIKGGSLINAGIEELKERFEDAKAQFQEQE